MKAEFFYYLNRLIGKLPFVDQDEHMAKYYRKNGIEIGSNTHIYSNIVTAEPFLLHIGNEVTISTKVDFVTHDNSINKVDRKCANLFGHIYIGDNCFIGERAMIMYGVRLANNIIVAAGSVVVNSFDEERVIIGGNPARIIGTWDNFIAQNQEKAMGRVEVKSKLFTNPEKFIEKKVKK